MSEDKDDGLDHLFRKNLEDAPGGPGYSEDDWDALEMMLDKREKRRGFILLASCFSRCCRIAVAVFRMVGIPASNQTRSNAKNSEERY